MDEGHFHHILKGKTRTLSFDSQNILFSLQEKFEVKVFSCINDWRGSEKRDTCAQFESPEHVGIAVFVFSKRCASGEKRKEGKQKKREESHLHLVSIVRTTLYKFLIYPPINYF